MATNNNNETKSFRDMYAVITATVLASLKAGIVPWLRPWAASGDRSVPRSASTGKAYRSANMIHLMIKGQLSGYVSPWWITYKQCQKLGGNVRLSECKKWTPVLFWKSFPEKRDGKKTGRMIPFARSFLVYNFDQCEIPGNIAERYVARLERVAGPIAEPNPVPAIGDEFAAADDSSSAYLERESIPLRIGGDSAHYNPALDSIAMPTRESFHGVAEYFSTLFHECIHSTGHGSRLKRELTNPFGSNRYAREELVAEMGAAFCAGRTAIDVPAVTGNRDSYIANWIAKLEDNPKMIVWAASRAEKATAMIFGETADERDPGERETALEYNAAK